MIDDGHRPVGNGADRRLDQAPGGPRAQQPVDVVDAEREDEAADHQATRSEIVASRAVSDGVTAWAVRSTP